MDYLTLKKNLAFLADAGQTPPPFAENSANNASFFYVLPQYVYDIIYHELYCMLLFEYNNFF